MIVNITDTDSRFVLAIISSFAILPAKKLKTILTMVIFKYLINKFSNIECVPQ